MTPEQWIKLRSRCKEPNREKLEHALAEFYEYMGWKPFDYIVYVQGSGRFRFNTRWSYYNGRNETAASKRVKEINKSTSQSTRSAQSNPPDPLREIYPTKGMLANFPKRDESSQEFARKLKPLLEEALDIIPNTHVPIVLEKPLVVHLNENERLHNPDGPAVLWRNGTRRYAWNGVDVSARFIERPPTLSYINRQRNSERKRVLIERYGEQRYIDEMKAELVCEDDCGKLWIIRRPMISQFRFVYDVDGRYRQKTERVPDPNREDIVFVEVVNSSPEPDGSFRKFFIRVPPTCTTPKRAVEWSFGLKVGRYRPSVQT